MKRKEGSMMNILFIGGTGLISTAVSQLAIEKGYDLHIMNRGLRKDDLPSSVHRLNCDIQDEARVKRLLSGKHFDAVVDWIAFKEEDVRRAYRLFKGHTDQYVFISSTSAYQKPIPRIPITEDDVPLGNPYWTYSQNKEACETFLLGLDDPEFPVTVIRPSHTYDDRSIVSQLNSWKHPYTLFSRIKRNKPIIIPDDGKSLWTLTYNKDFAHGFLDVLGNPQTYRNVYHLTSKKVYTWLDIHHMIEDALGVTTKVVFIPTETIVRSFEEFKGPLMGDMKDSVVFDNSKIESVSPNYRSKTDYRDVLKKVVAYYDKHPELQVLDVAFDQRYDELIEDYENRT
jgi:nucleoside-diphosphate-sugar epimerase